MSAERPSAERNLLFAIMAVQVRMAERAVVVGALRAWVRDRSRWIGELLVELAALDADQHDALARLVDAQIRAQGGDPLRSLSRLCETAEARALISELGAEELEGTAGLLVPGMDVSTASHDLGGSGAATPADVDVAWAARFRKRSVEPFIRGGLGSLFEADDLEIGRRVVVKELQAKNRNDQVARRRLRFEAEVTGRLEHPNIIPIYGRGTREDGEPYYAMRLVPTPRTLGDLIREYHAGPRRGGSAERSLAFRDLLARFAAVCDAVEYAHSRGVLHRDLKPANVLVGEFGETLVADWGLAKFIGVPEPDPTETAPPTLDPLVSLSGTAMTGGLPGLVGTPAYAPPEQARGDRDLGPTADVYALGAMLYEILTGRHRFEGVEGGRIGRAELVERIEAGRFPAPRAVEPKADRALEAICLKALATDPKGRYRSVRALRRDVDRWIADEAISARREPLTGRLARWGRKHRTLAASATLAVLCLGVGLGATSSVARSRDQARRQAEDRLEMAMDSYRQYFSGFNEEAIKSGRVPKDLVESLLSTPLAFYERLTAELASRRRPSARERALLARGRSDLGRLLTNLGRLEEAGDEDRAAVGLYRGLVAGDPASAEYRDGLALTLNNLGRVLAATDDLAGAREAYVESVAVSESLAADHPEAPGYREGLSRGYTNLGLLLVAAGDPRSAGELYSKAAAIDEGLLAARPETPSYLYNLANDYVNMGITHNALGRTEAAVDAYRRAIAVDEGRASGGVDVPELRLCVGRARMNLGNVLRTMGRRVEAKEACRRALEALGSLVAAYPNVLGYRDELAMCHNNLGVVHFASGETAAACEEYRRSIAVREGLVAAHPDVPVFRDRLARAYMNLGITLCDAGDVGGGRGALEEAAAALEVLASGDGGASTYGDDLALCLMNLGNAHFAAGDREAGRAALRRSVAAFEALVASPAGVPDHLNSLGGALHNLGESLAAEGRHAEAVDLYGRAVGFQRRALDASPRMADYRRFLGAHYAGLAESLRALDRAGRAAEATRERVGLWPDDPRELYDAACGFALCAATARDGAEADAVATEAVATLGRAVAAGWRDGPRTGADPAFVALRGRADFRGLVDDLMDRGFPEDVFEGPGDARGR